MSLITDPHEAQDQLDANEPATKAEVMRFVGNHFQKVAAPAFRVMGEQIQRQSKQQNIAAVIVNDLIDFLESEGFETQKDGRVRLNAQHFNAFRKKRTNGNERMHEQLDA